MSDGFFRKVLAFSLKLDLLFPDQALAFFVFKKKRHILSWNCNIFLSGWTVRKSYSILFKSRSWVVEFLESILAFYLKQYLLYSHQSIDEEWLFFVFFIKNKVFRAEENSGLHKRIIFMNLFQFNFWGESVNRNRTIKIGKGCHYAISLIITRNFYISIDPVYPGSLP